MRRFCVKTRKPSVKKGSYHGKVFDSSVKHAHPPVKITDMRVKDYDKLVRNAPLLAKGMACAAASSNPLGRSGAVFRVIA